MTSCSRTCSTQAACSARSTLRTPAAASSSSRVRSTMRSRTCGRSGFVQLVVEVDIELRAGGDVQLADDVHHRQRGGRMGDGDPKRVRTEVRLRPVKMPSRGLSAHAGCSFARLLSSTQRFIGSDLSSTAPGGPPRCGARLPVLLRATAPQALDPSPAEDLHTPAAPARRCGFVTTTAGEPVGYGWARDAASGRRPRE